MILRISSYIDTFNISDPQYIQLWWHLQSQFNDPLQMIFYGNTQFNDPLQPGAPQKQGIFLSSIGNL